MKPGAPIWYCQQIAGGYGYGRDVPGVFVRRTPKRVVIEVETAHHERTVRIAVKSWNVRARED